MSVFRNAICHAILTSQHYCESDILVTSQLQAARQGLAMLIASAVVVLKHETSTLCQCHNSISVDFTFGVGDIVREVTNPAKFNSDRLVVETPREGNIYRS